MRCDSSCSELTSELLDDCDSASCVYSDSWQLLDGYPQTPSARDITGHQPRQKTVVHRTLRVMAPSSSTGLPKQPHTVDPCSCPGSPVGRQGIVSGPCAGWAPRRVFNKPTATALFGDSTGRAARRLLDYDNSYVDVCDWLEKQVGMPAGSAATQQQSGDSCCIPVVSSYDPMAKGMQQQLPPPAFKLLGIM